MKRLAGRPRHPERAAARPTSQDLQAPLEALVRASQARSAGSRPSRAAASSCCARTCWPPSDRDAAARPRPAPCCSRRQRHARRAARAPRAPAATPPPAAARAAPAADARRARRRRRRAARSSSSTASAASPRTAASTSIVLGAGQWTPAPWVNVIANPRFGFLVSESGAGYTWAVNSRENRLTPWSNDPVSDPPGEALYLRDEETRRALERRRRCRSASEPAPTSSATARATAASSTTAHGIAPRAAAVRRRRTTRSRSRA